MLIHLLYRIMLAAVFVLSATQVMAQEVSFNTLPALQVTTPVPAGAHVPGDIDGNGVSDLFIFSTATSQLSYWLMDTNNATGAVTRIGSQTFSVTPGYFVGAIGDFNGDGFADVVLTSSNHDLNLWTNNGKGGFTSTSLGTYTAGWILIGAGDVDGDGQDDLLWLNPTTCQFSYWSMANGVHVNTDVVPITCGYYPISIGYYTPSNRVSILWTSAAQDLQIWDSESAGFTPYSFGAYGPGSRMIALGGGYEGEGLSLVYINDTGDALGYELDRVFNSTGQQTQWGTNAYWGDISYTLPWSSAGFLIEGRGISKTGVIYQHGAEEIEVCPPMGGIGLESTPAPMPNTCPSFSVPAGSKIIGAMANGIVPGG